jgi:hypothetical protein
MKFTFKELDQRELHSEQVDVARYIFTSYFTDLYRDIPAKTLGITNVSVYLDDIFDKTEIALKRKVIRGFFIYIDNEPVGFLTCRLLEDPAIVLLCTMPIHLFHKDLEMEIRNAFLSYIHQQFPAVQNAVMMVRKANKMYASWCLQAGFEKDNDFFEKSIYLKTTYNFEWYEPYVYHFDQSMLL